MNNKSKTVKYLYSVYQILKTFVICHMSEEIWNKDEMVKLVFLNNVPHMIPNINEGVT